jgi:NAD(P)-dependent dehydrogenase (short-subunit alcohol dehydrogenase family)
MNIETCFNDKVVLITGGSQGIGKELARQILDCGGRVVLTGRSQARLDSAMEEFQEHGGNVMIRAGDVGDSSGAEPLIESILSKFGQLDVVINNAGLAGYGAVQDLSQQAVDTVIDTNIKGSIYISRAAIPHLDKGGAILFVSSLAALYGLPGYSLYSISKIGLTALAQGLAIELKEQGVFVGIAYVGFTANEKKKEWLSAFGKMELLPERDPRLVTPREETARLILNQIAARKPVKVHSWLGKLTFYMARFCPRGVGLVLGRRYITSARSEKTMV